MHVLPLMENSTPLLLATDMLVASAVPLFVTVMVVAALNAPTAVAAKLTGDGVAWNAGTRAGIVVTDQFENVVAESQLNAYAHALRVRFLRNDVELERVWKRCRRIEEIRRRSMPRCPSRCPLGRQAQGCWTRKRRR